MRLLTVILAGLLIYFQLNFWFGKNGYTTYRAVEKEIVVHRAENEKLSQRNQLVAAEIKDLKEGIEAVEERARLNYEMVKPNETFYRIVKENK
ncbi:MULTISPECIES: cell division protein FtsB [Volucribacter]|uniref:Cell division protein FtsB n=2 Tax=Volucribacter TaxID=256730 RepID=A0A4R1G189_9PAST|nr:MULTISPECIES: cell division protein FtsB [Volucribacter]MDG6895426.1 cell division protein FtsB [Volucribacter amazonae]TCJ98768.1 cell division protein FtsB [Volucribacter psittacicida]